MSTIRDDDLLLVWRNGVNYSCAAKDFKKLFEPTDPPLAAGTATTISGTAEVGKTLTATPGTATGGVAPISYATRWQVSVDGTSSWSDISGATGTTFVLTSAQLGKYVRAVTRATDLAAQTLELPSASSAQIAAASYTPPTGGTITVDGDYTVHKFTANGTFTVNSPLTNVQYLYVGGGGAGGANNGGGSGGGGAGGYVIGYHATLAPGAMTIVIGQSGQDTTINSSVVAYAGGAGRGNTSFGRGSDGASGGGGVGNSGNAGGLAVHGSQGLNGGSGSTNHGGGGGGATSPGGNATTGRGGNGGSGITNSITGTAVTYCVGGAGYGTGGGGNSGTPAGTNGAANTGSGGGGSTTSSATQGGSGIVVFRYLTAQS